MRLIIPVLDMDFKKFIEEWNSPVDYITAETSGSTGNPKQILLNKEFVKESALRTINFFGINDGSRLHSCVSPEFIGGKMMAVRSILSGCRFTWEDPSNRPLVGLDRSEEIDLVALVPSQMVYILDNKDGMPKIKNYLVGGSSITERLRLRIHESGITAYETYGMTETASHIALRKIEDKILPFETLPGIEVEKDKRGCLVIKFNSGEKFVTNDIAEVLSPSNFLIKGRIDNVIITGGRKVHPEEVERKLGELTAKPLMIKGEPDEKWGEKVVMMIEDTDNEVDDSQLLEKAKNILLPHEVPKKIYHIEKLPRTPNGKIKRK